MLAALPSNGTLLLSLFSNLSIESKAQYNWGCIGACSREIYQTNRLTDQYHQKETSDHNKLLQRVVKAEHELHDNQHFHPEILHLPTLEKYVERNITALNKRMISDFKIAYEYAEIELAVLRADLDEKLKKLTREINKLKKAHDDDHHWDDVSHQDVQILHRNLSRYIDRLEYGKITYLTDINKNVRQKFSKIKGSVEKFKRNNYCFCR